MNLSSLSQSLPKRTAAFLFLTLIVSGIAMGQSPRIEKTTTHPPLRPLAMSIAGRTSKDTATSDTVAYVQQWPGLYFEAAFEGKEVFFATGLGDVHLHIILDDEPPLSLIKPGIGVYRLSNLSAAKHRVRIEAINENQAAPYHFGGLAVAPDATPLPPPTSSRQIEFIGDSHTVGYGNTSPNHACTGDELWTTTDTSQAFGPLTAKHYNADYQTNAISGRGIVRNYNGFPADPMPVVYPFVLFDKKSPAADPRWQPQIIVINLGTNDFSTALNPGEKWKTREELRLDYETTYVKFIQGLRAKNPKAFFVLLANDTAAGEIQTEVQKVMSELQAAGETRLTYIPIKTMDLTACDWHPSLADHRMISGQLVEFIDAHPQLWENRR